MANSPELMDWLTTIHKMKDKRNTLGVIDALLTGDLLEMRGGTASFALGAQYRDRSATSHAADLNIPGIPNAILGFDENGIPSEYGYVSNNMGGSSNSLDFDLDRDVNAVYAEFSLPFMENVETQVAVRYEDYGDNVGSEVSPKFAISWRPIDSLLLRTSWSESFRAPNLSIIGSGLDASSVRFLDPLDNQDVRAGLLPPTNENASLESSYTLGGPAPNVGNEYADTYSVGFIWTPGGALEGFSAQADFWRFEVTDRVLPENATSALRRQVDLFSTLVGNPNNFVLNSSLDAGTSEEYYLPCNPDTLTAEFGLDSDERKDCVVDPRLYQVEGIEESLPNDERNIIQLKLGAINAGEITSDGVDVKLGYRWDNDWGNFGVGLDYTYVDQYTLKKIPGLENGLLDIGVTDAAGTTGDGNLVRSLPDHKGHLTLSWNQGDHGVTLINRYIGSYRDLTADLRRPEANPFVAALMSSRIDSYNRWDMQYRYSHVWGNSNLGATDFTFGVLDMFDEDIPIRETGSLDYDAQVHDGRGRRLYARALWRF
jgi:outer membrane receptor protein involved in Fe transport